MTDLVERPTFVGTVPPEVRKELADDLVYASAPQFRVVVGETSVAVSTRPSPTATWSVPVVCEVAK